MLTAIVGINWGDEGKGRMVDLLSEIRTSSSAIKAATTRGHTVVNEQGKFVLNLLPSGILRRDKVNVMGNGMVIDIAHLAARSKNSARAASRSLPKISASATAPSSASPTTSMQDCLEEDRLADRKFGSTRRGIAPIYADKYMKKAIRMGDLLHPDYLRARVEEVLDWKISASLPIPVRRSFPCRRSWIGSKSTASASSPTSATSATISLSPRARAKTSCSRRSWERCVTSTSAFIPTPLPPTPSRRMRPSERECLPSSSTRPSAS